MDDVLTLQLYLSRFGSLSFEYSDCLTLLHLTKLRDKVQEWEKERAKAEEKRRQGEFKALFKGLHRIIRGQ